MVKSCLEKSICISTVNSCPVYICSQSNSISVCQRSISEEMFPSSDRSKTFSVSVFVFFFVFFSCFAISNANDSLSTKLLELLERRDRQKEIVEEELNSLRKSVENNEIHESNCLSGYFPCSSSSSSSVSCIYDEWVCDGDRDCDGGEDEINCKKDCPDGQFRCLSNGRCIPRQWICDGEVDCSDGSDESLCSSHSSSTQKPHRSACPAQSNYVAEFDQCYSPLVVAFVDQSEASDVCRRFHPRAHLPVINSHEQDLFIRHLMLKENPELCPLGVWTSGRRSNSFRPFTWRLPSSEGKKEDEDEDEEEQRPMDYTNWMPQRPRIGFGQRENCVFIDRQNDFKWNQRRCEHLLCAVCQLDLH